MLTQIVMLTAKPEARDTLAEVLRSHVTASTAEPGVAEFRIYAQADAPHRFWAYERYVDAEALQEHGQTPHTRALFDVAKTTLQQPPEVLRLTPVTPEQPDNAAQAAGVAMVFVFPVHHDQRASLLAAFHDYVEQTRAEPGNLRFELYEIDGDLEHLAVFEIWRDMAAFEAHFTTAHAQALGDLMASAVPGEFADYLHITTDL